MLKILIYQRRIIKIGIIIIKLRILIIRIIFLNKYDQVETTEQIDNIIIHKPNNKITFHSTCKVFKEITGRFFDNYKNNPLRAESLAGFSSSLNEIAKHTYSSVLFQKFNTFSNIFIKNINSDGAGKTKKSLN